MKHKWDWDDDDYSTLAEALDAVCQDAVANGITISDNYDIHDCRCPFGALLGSIQFPEAESVERHAGVPHHIAWSFIEGFDNCPPNPLQDARAYVLGRQFRERYLS